MKITIDDKVCTKHKMTVPEVLFALAFRQAGKQVISNMVAREILSDVGGEYHVTQGWSDVLEEILAESSGSVKIDETRLLNLALKIQEVFPSGYKVDERTNAKYYHKSNSRSIQSALKRFITYYRDYTDEEILDAAKEYVASFRGNYSRIEMANYFVYKDNRNKGGEITSTLATFLENKDSGDGGVVVNTEDWLSNSRN